MPTHLKPRTPANQNERAITGRFVLLAILGFFGVVIGVNMIMATLAVTTFGGVETASSYKAGLEFSQEARAAQAQDALGWKVDGAVRSAAGAARIVEVGVHDAGGRTINGLDIEVSLHHPADARRDLTLTPRSLGNGLYNVTAEIPQGQWVLGIAIRKDGQRAFRSSSRVLVP